MVASVLSVGRPRSDCRGGRPRGRAGIERVLGTTQYLVAEADESDRSFLKLSPILAVVTNLDREHMDCYRDMADVERAFLDFMDNVPFYGAVTAWRGRSAAERDSSPCAAARVHVWSLRTRPTIAFEFLARWARTLCAVSGAYGRGPLGRLSCMCRVVTTLLNATAAVAIAQQLDVSAEKIAEGLNRFSRR